MGGVGMCIVQVTSSMNTSLQMKMKRHVPGNN